METMALALCLVLIMMNQLTVTVADTFPERCGDVMTDRTGVISNLFYPPNFWCEWVIEAEPGSTIELSFSYVNMAPESHLDCNYGAVTIYDGYPKDNIVLESICHHTEKKFYSTRPIMTVVFTTDSLNSGDKFEAHYTTYVTPTLERCGDVMTDRTGVISNLFYPPNFWCEWVIEAEPGSTIELSFFYVNMAPESHLDCNYGAVTIYDGYPKDNIVLESICHHTEKHFYSTRPIMTVVFTTDSLNSGDKFEAHYTTYVTATFAK